VTVAVVAAAAVVVDVDVDVVVVVAVVDVVAAAAAVVETVAVVPSLHFHNRFYASFCIDPHSKVLNPRNVHRLHRHLKFFIQIQNFYLRCCHKIVQSYFAEASSNLL
jgi:hypothetical protein